MAESGCMFCPLLWSYNFIIIQSFIGEIGQIHVCGSEIQQRPIREEVYSDIRQA